MKMPARYQELSSFRTPPGFRGKPAVIVQLWWIVQALLFHTSPQFMFGWRRFLLRCFGARIGKGVKIRPSVVITYPWKLQIGDHSWVGDECTLYNLGKITIGNDVALAHGVYLCTGTHDFTRPSFDILAREITIEDEAWITNDVFVGPGVTIGKGAVIGVRSTVLQDMPEGMICFGNPARPQKPRLDE